MNRCTVEERERGQEYRKKKKKKKKGEGKVGTRLKTFFYPEFRQGVED